jgi:hypothetical protein
MDSFTHQQKMSESDMYKSTITFDKISDIYPQSFVDELHEKSKGFDCNTTESMYDTLFSKVKFMPNHKQDKTIYYKPGSGLVHLTYDIEAKLNPKVIQELLEPEKQIEEPVDSLKECLEINKENKSEKYERRSLREDLGLTEKSEKKDDK